MMKKAFEENNWSFRIIIKNFFYFIFKHHLSLQNPTYYKDHINPYTQSNTA